MVNGTRSRTMPTSATVAGARVLLVMFAVVLGLVVLMPGEDRGANTLLTAVAHWAAEWGVPYSLAFNTLEFAANIALFVPLGVLLPLALGSTSARTLWVTVGVGLAVSGVIEFAQQFIAGRVSDPRDLVSNTLGAAVGALAVYVVTRRLRASR